MSNEANFIQESAFPYETQPETPEEKSQKEHYRRRLAEKLKDPEFRKIEGFPLGTDEAILALSYPPYYTACPNPFLEEILEQWQLERQALRKELDLPDEEHLPAGLRAYQREPFAADVSEGKNHPIYNAHSYHTKVPHKAIMRYILHYTDPGDIVLDGFCGTGMTGVAAQLCDDKKAVEELGYRVDKKGIIYDGEKAISRLGARKAVLNDLSPAATFIAYNYNTPVDARAFEKEAKRIIAEVEKECGWMYETRHSDGSIGRINYTVWSDVFRCPYCAKEMVFWDVAVEQQNGSIREDWPCPGCGSRLAKSPRRDSGAIKVERVMDTIYDHALNEAIHQARQVPVLINYSVGKKRFEKKPEKYDLDLLKKIEDLEIPYDFPTNRMPEGDESRRNDDEGITHVHHFYTKRNLWVYSKLFTGKNRQIIKFLYTSTMINTSKLYAFRTNRKGGDVSGTLFIPTLREEINIIYSIENKLQRICKALIKKNKRDYLIETNATNINLITKNDSIDYVFIDPPFGGNLMYSELNYLWESWLKVTTNNSEEAIVNKEQKKGINEYQRLMESCFFAYIKGLKASRWMTVEFHNSHNSIWNAIQDALLSAGFIVADVRTLDKKQGTFKQITTSAAVKQDLVISAYKPSNEFEKKFSQENGSVAGAWEFIRQHLEQLPMPSLKGGKVEVLGERMPYLLYDRMVAFHLVRGLSVPLSASEFYQGLSQRWLSRDGMVFTAAQTTQYDQLRLQAESVQQLALFVTDEVSAIQWLRAELSADGGNGPQTYGELQPKFVRQWHPQKYEQLPELLVLLEQNFLKDADERWFVPDAENSAHLEALRERDLLREFGEYTRGSGRIRVFRSEAIKAGFSRAWGEHRYAEIVQVAQRLPEQALQEDAKLKLYYDNALNRAPQAVRQERLI